jgi:hypothetical protein
MKKNILQWCFLYVLFFAGNQTFGIAKNVNDLTTSSQIRDVEQMKVTIQNKEHIAKQIANGFNKKSLKDVRNNKENKGWGLSTNLSTNGIGGELSKELSKNKKLAGRISFNYLPYSFNNISFDFSKTKLNAKADITLGAIGAYLDWHPFSNSFKITCGAAYMLNQVKGNALLTDSVKQGEIKIAPNSVGKINVGIETNPIAPYLGIGFGRAVPKNRVGFGVEMGTYYIGSPKLSFVCTGLLEPTSNQEALLEDKIKSFQWLPQILFKLTVKISK